MRKIAVIAGTSDARELIGLLLERAYTVTAFVATAYGKEVLSGLDCTIHVGRLDASGFSAVLSQMDAVIDASHPFAVQVTETVRTVCRQLGLRYYRLTRGAQQYAYSKIFSVPDKETAAEVLAVQKGNILFTTGGNTLAFYEAHVPDFSSRGYARILDTAESRKITSTITCHRIYAMPPFSVADTVAILQQHQIAILVSKDSGVQGGVPEKIEAAKQCNIPILLIRAPKEQGYSMEQLIKQIGADLQC
jgi:precorrin-6x reductase